MPKKSRDKGKRGERELSAELTRLFGADCRRGVQYCGANGDADVVGLEGVHIECKRAETFSLYKALEQAESDAKEGLVPVVMHRRNKTRWVAVVYLDDLAALVAKLQEKGGA